MWFIFLTLAFLSSAYIANIAGSFFQSYPTSGSFSRSAVNINAGAVTGFSSIVTGALMIAFSPTRQYFLFLSNGM